MKMKVILWWVAVLSFGVVSKVAAQGTVSNGGFEMLAHPANSIVTLSVGTTNLPGWAVAGTGSLFHVTTPLQGWSFAALEGHQFISFNGNNVKLTQTLNTVAGQSYEVSFSAGWFQGEAAMRVFGEVFSTNGNLLGSTNVAVPQTAGWVSPARFRFVAADKTVLQFRSTNATPNVDLVMDAVSVEPVVRPLSIQASPVQLCWASETNRFYQLQYKSELTSTNWTDLGPPMPGNGSTICTEQPVTEPRRFFQAVLLP